ncbi:MAG: hypothetical protein KAS65_01855 [Candidatus Aminicenantes bacterium]|nr:hypothetical protein [Candidatus Aminicenantes bacterium]
MRIDEYFRNDIQAGIIPELVLPLSEKTGCLGETVSRLKQEHLEIWWDTPDRFPLLNRKHSFNQQRENEKKINPLVKRMCRYLEHNQAEQSCSQEMVRDPFLQPKDFIHQLTDLIGTPINEQYGEGFIRASRIFLEKVRRFDPGLIIEDAYQAMRNIWIMNSLQISMGLPVDCTDSMFAYSLLYPYTDNLMDSRFQSLENKIRLNRSLKNRLEGRSQTCHDELEEKISRLIGRIEREFPRQRFPEVFQSLLLIFNAQIKSLIEQQHSGVPYLRDILAISFEKGGSSVLADGYLLSGRLTPKQQSACFGWGSFLQLSDDIQDVVMDKKNGHMTIFSQTVGKYQLDRLANKLLNYIARMMDMYLSDPKIRELMELSQNNFNILVIEAIGKNPELFSREYVSRIETYSPVSFSYLRKLRKKLIKRLKKKKRLIADLDTVSAGFLALTSRLHETGD